MFTKGVIDRVMINSAQTPKLEKRGDFLAG